MDNVKKIAILQPNYIAWKGVFDLISRVDVFVFYDDVQYTVKDWRNRNKIKTPQGALWLSVPVVCKGRRKQLICEAEIDNTTNWRKDHFKTIKNNYSKAKYFKDYEYVLEELYIKRKWEKISELDIFSTKLIADVLNLKVQWAVSSDLNLKGDKDGGKAIKLCKYFRCNYFINGPAAKTFLDENKFKSENISLKYMEYMYDEYEQLYPPFNHRVSVLDVLFNCGKDAKSFICKGNNKA